MSWWELTIFFLPLPAAVGCLWRVGSCMLLLDLQLLLFWYVSAINKEVLKKKVPVSILHIYV